MATLTGFVLLSVLALATTACSPAMVSRSATPGAGATGAPAQGNEGTPALGPSPSPDPRIGEPSPVADDVVGAMLEVITAQRPSYAFQLLPDRLDGDWSLDGDANDGTGPGRLYIDVTTRAGMLTANPCADRDFRQGGACAIRDLADGDRLFLRDTVEANGIVTVVVALVHRDRSGITAEASNFSMAALPTGPLVGGEDHIPDATRAAPLYSVTELAELVLAIDNRLRSLPPG